MSIHLRKTRLAAESGRRAEVVGNSLGAGREATKMSKEETRRDNRTEKRSRKRDKPDEDEEAHGHQSNHLTNLLDGHARGLNGFSQPNKVVCPEMCCFCFDVLLHHLTRAQAPRSPYFTNDEL